MSITRFQMSLALLIALLLHGIFALWLGRPTSVKLPEPPPPPLRVTLHTPVAPATAAPLPEKIPEPPPPEPEAVKPPKPAPKPKPEVKPKPAPEPVVRKVVPEPSPAKQQSAEIPENTPPPRPVETAALLPDKMAAAQYEQLLVAWLEKHKKYPRRAKRLRIEGEGVLRILIDRTGRTRQIKLEQPTGNRLLDKAALEMAQRADPFPPMPDSDPRQKLEFFVPVAFVLQ